MTALDLLAPLGSVLLGAGITYWLNVRARRRSHVEDLFADAIASVAVAEASKDYAPRVTRWSPDVSDEEYRDFLKQVGREATENHLRKLTEAREALARVLPYRPELEPYCWRFPAAIYERAGEIITLLRQGPAASRGLARGR